MQVFFLTSQELHDIVMQILIGNATDLGGGEALRKQRLMERGQIGRVFEILRIALHAVEV